jgi:hypothetical protein
MGTRPVCMNVCKNLFYLTRERNILIEGQYVRFSFYITKSDLDRVSCLNFPDNPLLIIARGIASSPLWSVMNSLSASHLQKFLSWVISIPLISPG